MSEVSHQKIDVNKIKIVPDGSSFTGYSIKPLDPGAEEGVPGLPASVFEVALYKENERLGKENIKLRNFIDKLRIMSHGDPAWALDLMTCELVEFMIGTDVDVAV